MFTRDIGVDLGTANTLVCVKGKGIIMREPSVVAYDIRNDAVRAVGTEAKEMIGRTPGSIVAVRPLKDGVIADFTATQLLLKNILYKISSRYNANKPRVVVGVPSGITEVEERAVEEAILQAGAREVYLIEEPMAAAIGANLDVAEPSGNIIVDIGGGTTDIAVISLGGAVVSDSIKVGGDKFDSAIADYIKKKHNLLIGERSAEKLKIEIGTAIKDDEEQFMNISGRNMIKGLPETIKISSREIAEALEDCIKQIVVTARTVLEKTPPELAADISTSGIVMTGGGALLKNLGKRIEEATGINVVVADDPLSCVAKGTGSSLSSLDLLEKGGAFKRKKKINK